MAFSEFYARTDGDDNFGGSSDSATAKDTTTNATAIHVGSPNGKHTILDNVGGNFSNTEIDDFIAWDVGGTKELGIVLSVEDASNITVMSLTAAAAYTNLANVTINVGGSWKTIQYAVDTVNHSATATDDWRNAAGHPARINVKNAAWNEGVLFDTQTGLATAYITVQGYGTNPGDGTRTDWDNTTVNATIKFAGDRYYHIKDFDLDNSSATPALPCLWNNNSLRNIFENLDITGNYTAGLVHSLKWSTFLNCSIHMRTGKSGPNIGSSSDICTFEGCEFYGGNSATGGNCETATAWSFAYCIFRDSVAGPGCHVTAGDVIASFHNCVFYSNAAAGLDTESIAHVANCIFQSNTGVGIDANGVTVHGARNAFNGNSSSTTPAGSYISMGDGDVTITGDPFTAPGSPDFDFSLNSTANRGAALKEAGFPGTFLEGNSVGFIDVGAVIHEDPAGGGGGVIKQVGVGGGMVG